MSFFDFHFRPGALISSALAVKSAAAENGAFAWCFGQRLRHSISDGRWICRRQRPVRRQILGWLNGFFLQLEILTAASLALSNPTDSASDFPAQFLLIARVVLPSGQFLESTALFQR